MHVEAPTCGQSLPVEALSFLHPSTSVEPTITVSLSHNPLVPWGLPLSCYGQTARIQWLQAIAYQDPLGGWPSLLHGPWFAVSGRLQSSHHLDYFLRLRCSIPLKLLILYSRSSALSTNPLITGTVQGVPVLSLSVIHPSFFKRLLLFGPPLSSKRGHSEKTIVNQFAFGNQSHHFLAFLTPIFHCLSSPTPLVRRAMLCATPATPPSCYTKDVHEVE